MELEIVFVTIAITLALVLALRELMLWYWKINSIERLLSQILNMLHFIATRTAEQSAPGPTQAVSMPAAPEPSGPASAATGTKPTRMFGKINLNIVLAVLSLLVAAILIWIRLTT